MEESKIIEKDLGSGGCKYHSTRNFEGREEGYCGLMKSYCNSDDGPACEVFLTCIYDYPAGGLENL